MVFKLGNRALLAILVITALLAQMTVVHGQGLDGGPQSLITLLFTSPTGLITFFIELVLGIGLGYLSVKAAKYILALIAIFIIGVLLNVWQSGNLREIMSDLNLQWSKVFPVIQALIVIVGLTTVLPITLGFVIGFVIGLQK